MGASIFGGFLSGLGKSNRQPERGANSVGKRTQAKPIELVCHFLTWMAPSSWSLDAQLRRGLIHAVRERTAYHERDGCELVAQIACQKLPHIFLSEVLVPLPGETATVWDGMRAAPGPQAVAESISAELGACEVVPALQRIDDIDSDREGASPSVGAHARSLAATVRGLPDSLVLIGDIVSRGTTMVACAHVLREAGYEGRIKAFACAYVLSERAAARDYGTRMYRWDGRSDYPEQREL